MSNLSLNMLLALVAPQVNLLFFIMGLIAHLLLKSTQHPPPPPPAGPPPLPTYTSQVSPQASIPHADSALAFFA